MPFLRRTNDQVGPAEYSDERPDPRSVTRESAGTLPLIETKPGSTFDRASAPSYGPAPIGRTVLSRALRFLRYARARSALECGALTPLSILFLSFAPRIEKVTKVKYERVNDQKRR
jgi:hypothetical protein